MEWNKEFRPRAKHLTQRTWESYIPTFNEQFSQNKLIRDVTNFGSKEIQILDSENQELKDLSCVGLSSFCGVERSTKIHQLGTN